MQAFTAARTPELDFGSERSRALGDSLRQRGFRTVGVIFSRSVFADDDTREGVVRMLAEAQVAARFYRYDRLPDSRDPFSAERGSFVEASPRVVDAIAAELRADPPEAVVAIGGGSAIDTGKALSVALVEQGSIRDYLEGVGSREPSGRKVPFVAIPTTAGTGSEATKNAVLSEVGEGGFKKSLRHDRFVPDLALIDPLLHLSCPRELTAASGLDAITQLLEAYVSTTATPYTDALALDGLVWAGRSFSRVVERGDTDVDARAGMAYAAYLSGICLATAGLGTVHGLAGPAGAVTSVPHGVFCGSLLPGVTQWTVERLVSRRDALGVLGRYAAAGRALTGRTTGSMEDQIQMLIDRLEEYARIGGLRPLSAYGLTDSVARAIASAGGNKANPYAFSEDERYDLIAARL